MLVDSDRSAPALSRVLCRKRAAVYVPQLLGLLTFLAVEFAIWRSYANMPTLDEGHVKQGVEHALIAMAVMVPAGAVTYLLWVFKRPRNFRPKGRLGRINAKMGNFWQAVSPGRVWNSPDEESRDVGRL